MFSVFDVFRKKRTVIRESTRVLLADGIWTEPTISTFEILASDEPVPGRVIELMPEGAREEVMKMLITSTKLNSVREGYSSPDRVIIEDEEYIVQEIHSYQNLIPLMNHYEVIIVKSVRDAN